MSRVKHSNTKPEVEVRSILHRMGFRFRKNVTTIIGSPDVVLKKYNSLIFVNGCFWHGHARCGKSKVPATNSDFWKLKIQRNKNRDKKYERKLHKIGWKVLNVWECELKNKEKLSLKMKRFLLK